MAISLLRRVGGFLVIHAPEIAAVLAVSHPLPQERHAMVDDAVGARQPEQMRDGEAMHHSRCVVHMPVRAFVSGLRRERPRVLVQREEAARRIERGKLEELEEGAGVIDEPQPVRRQRREARRPGRWKFLDCGHPSYQTRLRSKTKRRGRRETGPARSVRPPRGRPCVTNYIASIKLGKLRGFEAPARPGAAIDPQQFLKHGVGPAKRGQRDLRRRSSGFARELNPFSRLRNLLCHVILQIVAGDI